MGDKVTNVLRDLRAWTNPILLKIHTPVVWHNTCASPKSSSRHLRLLAHVLRRLTRILR